MRIKRNGVSIVIQSKEGKITKQKLKTIATYSLSILAVIAMILYIVLMIWVRCEFAETPISEIPSWAWWFMGENK